MKIKISVIFVFFLLTSKFLFADIGPGNDEHNVTRCVKITNINDFPSLVVLAAYDYPLPGSGKLKYYVVESDKCLKISYEPGVLQIFALEKSEFDRIGGLKALQAEKIESKFVSKERIELYGGGIVENNNSLAEEDIEYVIEETSGATLKLKKAKQTSKFSDGTPDKVEIFP